MYVQYLYLHSCISSIPSVYARKVQSVPPLHYVFVIHQCQDFYFHHFAHVRFFSFVYYYTSILFHGTHGCTQTPTKITSRMQCVLRRFPFGTMCTLGDFLYFDYLYLFFYSYPLSQRGLQLCIWQQQLLSKKILKIGTILSTVETK